MEELLAERGLDVNYATVRPWAGKFDFAYAHELVDISHAGRCPFPRERVGNRLAHARAIPRP